MFKHNGLPIIDHRNDDCLLENGVAVRRGDGNICCGYDVRVVQDCVGRDMARFCYSFGDESIYCLNAFPLCYGYVSRMMREVSCQCITRYGGYQLGNDDPGFDVHVAESEYRFDGDTTLI